MTRLQIVASMTRKGRISHGDQSGVWRELRANSDIDRIHENTATPFSEFS